MDPEQGIGDDLDGGGVWERSLIPATNLRMGGYASHEITIVPDGGGSCAVLTSGQTNVESWERTRDEQTFQGTSVDLLVAVIGGRRRGS